MIVVVDASVAAMWFLPEPQSEAAATLLASTHDLVAPDLMRLEVGGALLRAVRRGFLNREDASAAIARLAPPSMRFEPGGARAEAALELAETHGGSIYDGAYIALARDLDATVVTNDAGLADTARAAGVAAWLLSDPPPHGLAP